MTHGGVRQHVFTGVGLHFWDAADGDPLRTPADEPQARVSEAALSWKELAENFCQLLPHRFTVHDDSFVSEEPVSPRLCQHRTFPII